MYLRTYVWLSMYLRVWKLVLFFVRMKEIVCMYVCMLLRYRCKKGKALKVEKVTVNGGLVLVIDSCVVYWIVRKSEGRVP